MPILKSCCCCGLQRGCIVAGIFSVVTSLAWAAWGGYNLYESGILQTESFSDIAPFYYGYAVGVGLWVFLFLSSFLLVAGVCCDRRGLLIPYIVAAILAILVHCALCALYLYILILAFDEGYVNDVFNLTALSLSGVFIVLDSLSLLCVISRYQELRYGEDARLVRQESVFPVQSPSIAMTASQPRRY
ncbi:uncharacterized protein LOC110984108 [Acanthaster planci]|uniref:Uncharacterized protein LOC110984108 n=1 Tax=Acanthaster planci TaxID=133434 RepID=A0A8B7Z3U2_ACAPL|nr:uncharacterized protein LOC110984108 [Acanthaster planci]XP_022099627.1 uncharacterized protein LOC110984108 [Acanthaster planci]